MTLAPTKLDASQADIDAISAVATEYVKSYAAGDASRHERVYHPECVKRAYLTDPESGVTELMNLSPRVMADYAAASGPMDADCDVDVIIDDIAGDMASVRVYSCNWIDFVHVVRARGEWRLLHVTWRGRDGG